MKGSEIINRINLDNMESVLKENNHVLIACTNVNEDYRELMRNLELVAAYMGMNVRIYYAMDDLLPYLEKKFHISGTPTYLLIKEGILVDSLLGKNSTQSLMSFLKPYLPVPSVDTPDKSSPREAR